jgi:hypothetical protein
MDVLEEHLTEANMAQCVIVLDGLRIQCRGKVLQCIDRLEFARERDAIRQDRVAQRLDPEMISGKHQGTFRFIPERERPEAVQISEHFSIERSPGIGGKFFRAGLRTLEQESTLDAGV